MRGSPADATTIAIAGKEGAGLRLEAAAAPAVVDLADATLRFEARNITKVSYHLVSEAGLTPFIGLSMVKRVWFGEPNFQPALAAGEGLEERWDFSDVQ